MKDFPTYGYAPIDIAHWFLASIDREAGDSITHLKLQKLVYYAQAWALALNSKSLFEEDLEAWTHGPVVRSIYNEFKDHSSDAIPQTKTKTVEIKEKEVLCLLNQINNVYAERTAKFLKEKTHEELPWKTARGGLALEARCTEKISKKVMQEFYKKQLSENE